MKIGMVLDKVFPFDTRVENEAASLAENGFDVYLICFTYDNSLPLQEIYKGFNIIRLKVRKKWINLGRALINTFFDFYTYYWAKKIKKFILKKNIQVLHVHDLYLLGAAFLANSGINIPIVSDLHENYVEGLRQYRFSSTFPGNIFISINKWIKTEIDWCSKADRIITVIEEAVDRYAELGIKRNKITVVANYVNTKQFLDTEDFPDIINRYKNNFVATYIGAFDIHRGLESVLYAIPDIIKKIPNFKLVLVGYGRNYNKLLKIAKKLNILEYISFEGFQSPQKIPSYIKASKVCLIPHLKTAHTDNTIPHKLFHYMVLGKPVLASNCNPVKRIIENSGTGLIHRDGDSKDIARQLNFLYENSNSINQMGIRGPEIVASKYNWGSTSMNLINLYKEMNAKM